MGLSIAYKILTNNLLEGVLEADNDIKVKVNQTLTQDSTGTMVYLQLNALDISSIKTDLSVAYIDHNTIQSGFENADDQEFIRTCAEKYGIIFSKAGNGICHQLHLERFSKPGKLLIGSDSHTPTCGGVGMIAIGAGGLDVAVGMSNGFYDIKVPKVLNINLTGELCKWVSSKDVILYILKTLGVKGGVGYIIEYSGDGLKSLSVTDRATITNMGAELGVTTSIFPSDDITKDYFIRQGRIEDFSYISADKDATYDKSIEINLNLIQPQIAKPHSPDNVVNVDEVLNIKVDQVAIGSCTNSSYTDLMKVAKILKGKTICDHVSLVISPGSSSVLKMLSDNGALGDLISSGARILEASCGPCIGMGQAPKSNAISLRTFNRNFKGRCGTSSAEVYLVSPETAAISALTGKITNPKILEIDNYIELPSTFESLNSYFIYPNLNNNNFADTKIHMGPNIKPFPLNKVLDSSLSGTVLLKTIDNVTTDDIVPSNAKLLPFRSNIPELSKYCFKTLTDDFYDLAKEKNGGFVIGGDNYGQGSSREHAALIPLYLGVKAVIAKSFARIHKANLINSGIIPLIFEDFRDYDAIDKLDNLELNDLSSSFDSKTLKIYNSTKNTYFRVIIDASKRDIDVIKLGGYINFLKHNRQDY